MNGIDCGLLDLLVFHDLNLAGGVKHALRKKNEGGMVNSVNGLKKEKKKFNCRQRSGFLEEKLLDLKESNRV